MKIAAIIVAAGLSSRFENGHKLLAEVNGQPLVRYSVDAASASPVDDIVVVVASDGGKILAAAGPGHWNVIVNDVASEGLSSSIQAGLSAIDPASDGVLILLADMPNVTAEIIQQLCVAFKERGGSAIVYPQTSDGRQGNPVLWPRALFGDLKALRGDTGGKGILAAHPELHWPVRIDSDAITLDIDTVADLTRAAPTLTKNDEAGA